jgi:prepilin-type processing-associated H-X9-DG protein
VDFGRYWGCGLEFGTEEPERRHNDGSNVLFVDGHAKWLKEIEDRMWTINVD